jgi:diguanylate cyclase (GGDEF)-like protein/PAS domain S-box-containing protein
VDGTILYESPSIERILGYRPEELVGKNVFAYVHPQDLERVLSAFAAGLANPELRPSAEYRFRHKDGSWRYLESVGSNLLDDPNVGELVVNSRDVTERKKAEERLREAEARYRTLVEQIPAITYVEELSRNGKILVYMSPQYEAMLGYSPETGTPHPEHWLEIVHPDDRERVLVLAEDTRTDETLEPFRAEYRMLAKDGRVVWIRDEAQVVRDEGGRPLFWQGIMSDITERKALEERLKQWALHDPLTGLANRTLFADRLEHALAHLDRREESIAVLLVDLDDFKVINDSLGHEVGDRLLVGISKRLRVCVRPEDTVARFGGDEFAVLLEDAAQLSGTKQAAERIVRVLSTSFKLEEHEVFTSASAGVALSSAATDKPQDLLRNADLAMYEAKRRGKARYEVFDVNVSTAFFNRTELGDGLRRALEREEFRVYY